MSSTPKDPVAELAADPSDTPPKKDAKKPARKGRRKTSASYAQIGEGLDSFVAMVGVGVRMAGDDYCGDRIITQGPELSSALVELSRSNPQVKRMLSSLSRTSAWGGVIIATSALILPIMAHHGIIPGQIAALMGAPLDGMDVETGRARHPDRADRAGQDDARPSDPATPDLLAGSRQ